MPRSPAELHCADALTFIETLDEGSVDLVITSPPYCMGKEYDRSASVEDFIKEHERILRAILRPLRPGGSVCWQVGNHVQNNVLTPLDAIVYEIARQQGELLLRNRIVWTFGHGAHPPKRFSGRHETALWFTKGTPYYFDLDAVRVPQKYPGKKAYKGPQKGQLSGNPLGKNPGDVWDIPNVKAGHVEKTDHPCQFPVALASRFVRALCPVRGLVIDPYMGSGSTGVAAIMAERRFAGSDIESKYVEIARQRIGTAAQGNARIRPDRPSTPPDTNHAVAQVPAHFYKSENSEGIES